MSSGEHQLPLEVSTYWRECDNGLEQRERDGRWATSNAQLKESQKEIYHEEHREHEEKKRILIPNLRDLRALRGEKTLKLTALGEAIRGDSSACSYVLL